MNKRSPVKISSRIFSNLSKRMDVAIAGTFLVIFVVAGFVGPLILNQPYQMSHFYFAPPGTHGYLLGTDKYGRSELTRVLWGMRTSLVVSFTSVSGATLIGVGLGVVAAWSKPLDLLIMRLMDVLMAFPSILLAIGIMAMVGPGMSSVIEAIVIVYIPIFARVVRGPAMTELSKSYVEAAQSIGASPFRILSRHVVVNIIPILLVQISIALGDAIIIEAALSYLGLGISPPAASLGALLLSGQSFMFTAPWLVLAPGIAIAWAVFGFNLLGDALSQSK